MRFIKFKNQQVAYDTSGNKRGSAVILVHGFCEDSRMWSEFKSDLEEEHFVVVIDLPGFGESEVIENISIAEMAEAVGEIIKKLKLERCTYVGHSMGGYVGVEVAKQNANLLEGLVMFHSHPFADSEDKKQHRQKSIDFIKRQGHVLYVKQLFPNLFASGFARSNAFLIEKLTFRAAGSSEKGIINALAAMRDRVDNSAVLKNISCPVLYIIGEKDTTISLKDSLAQTHLAAIGDIHILPKAGHMGMFEAKKTCSKIIRHFIPFCQQIAPIL